MIAIGESWGMYYHCLQLLQLVYFELPYPPPLQARAVPWRRAWVTWWAGPWGPSWGSSRWILVWYWELDRHESVKTDLTVEYRPAPSHTHHDYTGDSYRHARWGGVPDPWLSSILDHRSWSLTSPRPQGPSWAAPRASPWSASWLLGSSASSRLTGEHWRPWHSRLEYIFIMLLVLQGQVGRMEPRVRRRCHWGWVCKVSPSLGGQRIHPEENWRSRFSRTFGPAGGCEGCRIRCCGVRGILGGDRLLHEQQHTLQPPGIVRGGGLASGQGLPVSDTTVILQSGRGERVAVALITERFIVIIRRDF